MPPSAGPGKAQHLGQALSFSQTLRRRVGAFAARLNAAREREDAGGRSSIGAAGDEFVGHRPYRPGDDIRQLDWSLYARVRAPHVKTHRATLREDWIVALDTSQSMLIGEPTKLQSAAEAAAAAMAVGLGTGALISVVGSESGRPWRAEASPARGFESIFVALERAGEASLNQGDGLGALTETLVNQKSRRGRASRVLLFGDFLDVDPVSILRLAGGGVRHRRRVHLGQVLAPIEWDPRLAVRAAGGEASFLDPDAPTQTPHTATTQALPAYRKKLESFVERWRTQARDHRMSHMAWRSDEPFEDFVRELLR